jgi:two-component system, response regulator RegA
MRKSTSAAPPAILPRIELERQSVDPGRVAIVADPSRNSLSALEADLRGLGLEVHSCTGGRELRQLVNASDATLIVIELRLDDGPSLRHIPWLKRSRPGASVVVLTGHPSVATALESARLGADGYLEKPATAEAVLEASRRVRRGTESAQEQPMGLNRAMWEYINRAVQSAGSISAAARILGLDRRSLRRMLAKYAP